jgi:hypothetical protein
MQQRTPSGAVAMALTKSEGEPGSCGQFRRCLRRNGPQRLVIRDRFKRDAGSFQDRALCEHRLERVHLLSVFEGVPDAHIRELSMGAIDRDVVVLEPRQCLERFTQRPLALDQQAFGLDQFGWIDASL